MKSFIPWQCFMETWQDFHFFDEIVEGEHNQQIDMRERERERERDKSNGLIRF